MKGAAVHSLQVAWLTAVSFGTCAVTLPSSTPTRWAAAADTEESQASSACTPTMTHSVWLRIDSYAIRPICFSLWTYFNRETRGEAAQCCRNKNARTSLLCDWFFSPRGTKVCQFSMSANSLGVLEPLTAFYLHLHLN